MYIFIIPAYNEERNIGLLLNKMKEKMDGKEYLIIIVNDGSKDNTKMIAESFKDKMPIKIVDHKINKGVGEVFRSGFKEALKDARDDDIIITKEADNTSDLAIFDNMVESISSGADLVLASCYAPGGRVLGTSLYRKILSWGANQLVKLIVPIKGIHTFSSFYRAHRGKFLKDIYAIYGEQMIEEDGFVCMVELLIKYGRLKPKVVEIPMILDGTIREGKSKMKTKKTIIAYFKLFIKTLARKGRK